MLMWLDMRGANIDPNLLLTCGFSIVFFVLGAIFGKYYRRSKD